MRRCSCFSPPRLSGPTPAAVAARTAAASRMPRCAGSRSVSSPRGPRASGRPVTAFPPESCPRALRLRRRGSCSSPPPTLASRRPGGVRWRRAPARLRKWRWHGTGALCHAQACLPTKAAPPREAAFRVEPRAPASPTQRHAGVRAERASLNGAQRPGGHGTSACPCTCVGASPALFSRSTPRPSADE